jgi:hypothetical protein
LGPSQANLFIQHYEIGLQILLKSREVFKCYRIFAEVVAQILDGKCQTHAHKDHYELK